MLAHHYHRGEKADQIRLVGRLSYAQDGPILKALNLNLYPTETHYIDRSFVLTGATTILITPGSGYFRVSKQLLRMTTNRMLDQGFGLDLVSLTTPPLHQSPIFSFLGSLSRDLTKTLDMVSVQWIRSGEAMTNRKEKRLHFGGSLSGSQCLSGMCKWWVSCPIGDVLDYVRHIL